MNLRSIFRPLLPPPVCLLCNLLSDTLICASCRQDFLPAPVHCRSCTNAVPERGELCGSCLQHGAGLDGLWIYARYHGVVRDVVHKAKYFHDRTALGVMEEGAEEIAPLMLADVPALSGAVCVPQPVSFIRLLQRGYNQCDFVADALAAGLGVRCDKQVLSRRFRLPQASAGGLKARRRNIAGAFLMRGEAPVVAVLCDDVFTTGSTMFEAARVLKAAGCAQVFGFAFAGVFD